MQPKFITFIQCTFDNKWKHAVGSEAGQEENMAIRNMTVFSSTETDAKINLIDMNLKEVRLQFRTEASVGVGNGMLYCNGVDVIDTQIRDAPPSSRLLYQETINGQNSNYKGRLKQRRS
jgi:hypothetical protein